QHGGRDSAHARATSRVESRGRRCPRVIGGSCCHAGIVPRRGSAVDYLGVIDRRTLDAYRGHRMATVSSRPGVGALLRAWRERRHRILAAHEPYPAVVFDRAWNVVSANSSMLAVTAEIDVDPALLEPPVNVLRVGLHPRGLAPLILNLAEWRAHFLEQLKRQV